MSIHTVHVKKKWCLLVETTSITGVQVLKDTIKCRSGSSVSEAALHFGNLGVFKPSALRIEEAFQFADCNAGPHNCHEDGNGHLPSLWIAWSTTGQPEGWTNPFEINQEIYDGVVWDAKKQTPKLSNADGDTKICIEDSDTEHYRWLV